MTQYDFGTLNPDAVDGVGLADLLNSWRTGLHSSHRGAARPAYAVAGMSWAKSVSASRTDLMYYDGAVDVMIVSVNPSTGAVIDASAFMRNASNLNAGTIPSARLVAADLLALVKTVDGVGSGLDADTLRGESAAYFFTRSNHTGTQLLSTISDAGPAASRGVGLADGNLVEVLADGKLPPLDGSNLTGVGGAAEAVVEIFDASGTWVKPAGAIAALVELWGAGGGGGVQDTSGASNWASGGSAGGYTSDMVLASDLGATEPVTIGAAGVGRTSSGSGTAGGSSSFAHLIAGGGGAGKQQASAAAPGSGDTLSIKQETGGVGQGYQAGGAATHAGGGGGGGAYGGDYAGGLSTYGGGGGRGGTGRNALAGVSPGGGGGGSYKYSSGDGAPGRVRVTTFF